MNITDIEKMFLRAWKYSFSRAKFFFVFSVLAACGFLTVIFRGISSEAGQWIHLSLAFLPIFISAAILLIMGNILIQIYQCEVKRETIDYLHIWRKTSHQLLGIVQLSVPLVFCFLILWMLLGIFYLFRAIPLIGKVIGSILAFGPFLLVLGSILLGFSTILILFFIAPATAFQEKMDHLLLQKMLKIFKINGFYAILLLSLGLIPLLFVVGILSLTAVITHMMYVEAYGGFSLVLKWFFMMLPFCAVLSPLAIFFFNFSAESYVFLRKKMMGKPAEESTS